MALIKFYEESHTYVNEDNGHIYKSVSQLLSLYKEKFDADKMSKIIAKKRNISQEEVLQEWDNTRNYSCERGTAFHLALENYIKYGEVSSEYKKVIENFQLCVEKQISDIKNIYSEILCYNNDFEVAGTSDICWEHSDNTFTIGDFKTNKQFRYNSKYKSWLKFPIDHLMECEFNTYTLQLSLYAYMYEIMTGKKCRGLLILWLNQDTGKWEPIHCNYMKYEVIMILKNYCRNKENYINTANRNDTETI